MSDPIVKVGVPPLMGQNDREVIAKLVEAVGILQGTTSENQRAVRVAEFEAKMAALEARIARAGV